MSQYADLWFTTPDGFNLYARDYACEKNGDAAAATVVCIPGLTRNSADFDRLSEHLRKNFRVLALDLRGRGKSQYDPCPSNYRPDVYAQDVVAMLNSLELARVNLIGTSLGGLVSMVLSALQPERVASVILNDIGPETNPEGLERIKAYVRNRSPVASWEQATSNTREILADAYPNFSYSDWQAFTRNIYREGEDGIPMLDYDRNILVPMEHSVEEVQGPADLWPVFAAMASIPTLLIRGALSDILTEDCVARMSKLHPTMVYTQLDSCGHAPLLTEPECLKAIDQFLL